ncbi:MAG: CARDB domain-containing protein [Candidatus Omnitrophota bacterium]
MRTGKFIFVLIFIFIVSFIGFTQAQDNKSDAITIESLEFIPAYGFKDIFTYIKSSGKLTIKNNTKDPINNLKFIIEIKEKNGLDWKKVSEGVVGISAGRQRAFDFNYLFDKPGEYVSRVKLDSDIFKKEIIANEKKLIVNRNVNIRPVKFDFISKDNKKELTVPVDGEFNLTLINNGKDASSEFKYRILIDGKAIGSDIVVKSLDVNKKEVFKVNHRFEVNQGGRHVIEAIVDPDNELKETRKDDGFITKEIIVYFTDVSLDSVKLILPEKTIELSKYKDTVEITNGITATLSIKVKNQGNMAVKKLDGEVSICGDKIPFSLKDILPNGGSKTYEFSYKFKNKGGCDLSVFLDRDNLLAESDKDNNKFSAKSNIEIK